MNGSRGLTKPQAHTAVVPIQQVIADSLPDELTKPMRRTTMWTKPEATEMRFGFEVTMYVCNR